MRHPLPSLTCALLATLASPAVLAKSQGDWEFAIGAHQVRPASDNGTLAGGTLDVDVGNDTRPTLSAEYFIRDNLGIEVLAAVPFEHDIAVAGLGTVASTRHLPPTVTLQYHFNTQGRVSPFVGAGVNFTAFYDEQTRGALSGADLRLGNSWGLAAHAGVDVRITDAGSLRLNARWIDIDTEVELDGAELGEVNIDPLVYGAAWVFRF